VDSFDWFLSCIDGVLILYGGFHEISGNVQVVYGAGFVEFFAEEGKRVNGDIIPSPFPEKRMFVMKQARLF
jgi:hypothetical protein